MIILTENDGGVIDLEKWQVTKKFKCNTASLKEAKDAVNKIDKKIPVLQEHVVPGTGCSFMVETHDTQFIYIRDIESGRSKRVIKGSANNDKKYASVVFIPNENGYDLHFCTKTYQDHKFVHTWNRWNLGVDVLRMLIQHRRLPLELDVEKILTRFS